MPPSTSCRCTSTPMSSRARSRSVSRKRACGRSSCSTEPAVRSSDDRRACDSRRRARARSLARRGCPDLRLPDDGGEPWRRLPAGRASPSRNRHAHRLGSNVRIDPLEELRELEGIARRQTGKRGVISVDSLLCFGSDEGAAALGLRRGSTPSSISITCSYDASTSRASDEALIFGCSSDVLRRTSTQ